MFHTVTQSPSWLGDRERWTGLSDTESQFSPLHITGLGEEGLSHRRAPALCYIRRPQGHNLIDSSQGPCNAGQISSIAQRRPNKAPESPGEPGSVRRPRVSITFKTTHDLGSHLAKILSLNILWSGCSEISSQLGLDFWALRSSPHCPILVRVLLSQFN